MPSSIKVHSKPTWLISFFILFSLSSSDPRTSEAGLYCSPAKSTDKNFVPVFVKEMEFLSQLVTLNLWGSHFVNSTPPMYGLAQCHQDLSHLDCLLCYAAGRTKLPRCLPATSARIYLDGCFLRYDNYSFFSESVDPDHDTVNCSSGSGAIVDQVANGGYGVAVVEGGAVGVYALAECWKTVNSSGCRACLQKASNEVRGCLPGKEGRGLNAGCYLRYSTEKFYDNGGESEGGSGSSRTGLTIAIVLAAAALILVSLFAAYAGYASLSKIKEERKNLGKVSSIINKSSLNFKYETLERATEYFNPSRKLGQGGAGSVYMGTLPNGEIVAVKRLIFNTRQWVDEFFNEVNLISGIQHKNLVKLLGCSIEGPESLLVYEYVPNRSIDQFMFDKNKIQTLNWEQRFDIIVGTAEGLAYLHGGLQMRIIHRDIKGSNILLDENLTPKIADFGLARCLGADKTHLSTGIAGTLGYMAPEYLVRGQLTEKADVYSFGVLVLEIVCGRKNSVFTQDSGSLLQRIGRFLHPNQPPFLNAHVLESAISRSNSANTSMSNMATKIEVSGPFTESSSMHSSMDHQEEQKLMQ
ncbi:Cysteine-rich receptor-like protein kinase 42 [Vitis vinifera]|uniref:Cysteine-rich receptor-like protein kinase 42 n=1 Tax=Vitis vinifera TaxID=29760 RepID=A0A438JIY3_VITVI|nr:Cysteine-rich receptor-like protein kinase 42 [Vitis vinifera]